MAILAPSTPSDFGNEIDDLSEAYSPQQLQQKYAITKELKYLLALQKVTSIVQEAQRSLTASQEQTEGNVKDQLERGLMERAEDVIELLGQPQGQPQGQTQMVAQGGIIGYSNGGDVEEEADTVNFADLAAQYGAEAVSSLADWASENPVEAGLIGLSFIPFVGPGLSAAGRGAMGAFKIGKKGYEWLKANKTAQNIADVAKKSVTKPRKITRGNVDDELGDAAKALGYPKTTGKSETMRQYAPGKGLGIVSAGAAASSMLGDDEEEKEGIETLVEPENQGIGGQGNQGQGPMGTKIDDFEIESIINRGETPNYRQQAQDSVDTLAQIAGGEDRLKTVEERALQDTSKVREEGAEAFMGRAGETGIRDNLVKLFEEADADLAALNNPEEMSRDLRIATFANVGGTGVGQIFGNMSKAFLETKGAQKELLRAAIEKRTGNALKVIELDKELFMAGEAEGLKLYEIAEAAKSEALSDLTGFSRDRRKQIVDTMQILQKSDDDRIKNALAAIKEISNSLNRRNRADLVSYAGAQETLQGINDARRAAFISFMAANERGTELLNKVEILKAEGETLTPDEAQELADIKTQVNILVNGFLSLEGALQKEEQATQIARANDPTRVSQREDEFLKQLQRLRI